MKARVLMMMMGVTAALSLAACDSGPAASLQTPAAQSPRPLASASDPATRESATANPSFDQGHTVHITAAGLQPQALVSMCCDPIVFKNETNGAVTVFFDVSKKSSGLVAPGGSWQWTPPNPESVIYHLVENPKESGQVQIESPNW